MRVKLQYIRIVLHLIRGNFLTKAKEKKSLVIPSNEQNDTIPPAHLQAHPTELTQASVLDLQRNLLCPLRPDIPSSAATQPPFHSLIRNGSN